MFSNTFSVGYISKIKSSLNLRYYVEACNEWRDPPPPLSAWTTQLRRNVASMASRWRRCVRFDRSGKRTPDLPRRQRCLHPMSEPVERIECAVAQLSYPKAKKLRTNDDIATIEFSIFK